MTDTIGWGDVERLPRRLPVIGTSRRRRVVALVVVLTVIAGAAAWPTFRSWRADTAARHLRSLWREAVAYDQARWATLADVRDRLGAADGADFLTAMRLVDRQESARLRSLRRDVDGLRPWAADVSRARRSVSRSLSADLTGLAREIAAPATADPIGMLPLPWEPDVAEPWTSAQSSIDALTRRRRLGPERPPTVRLDAAAAILATLARPSDEPLHLRLVAAGPDAIDVTDLGTGRGAVHHVVLGADTLGWSAVRVLGDNVVGNVDGGVTVVPLSGARPRTYPGATVVSQTGLPMWLWDFGAQRLLALDAHGRKVGTARISSSPQAFAGVGDGRSIVVDDSLQAGGFTGPNTFHLLQPRTGHVVRLPTTGCATLPGVDGGLTVVPTEPSCREPVTLRIFDGDGRIRRTAPLPGGAGLSAGPLPSPDGASVAVQLEETASDGSPTPGDIAVLDVASGVWTRLPHSDAWGLVQWSPDAGVLLLRDQDNLATSPVAELAYVRPGDPRLHSLRVYAEQGAGLFLVD